MILLDTYRHAFSTRWQKARPLLHKGPLSWGLIVVVSAVFCLPFILIFRMNDIWEAYLSLALVPLAISALLRNSAGALFCWLLILVGLETIGGSAPSTLPHPGAIAIIGIGQLIMALAAGQFCRVRKQLAQAYATIQKQALTDALTGLPNHRAIIDQLDKELERAQRFGRPLALLFLDADHFKAVNDTHGHGAGDVVLRQIGALTTSVLRGGDTMGRFGGEEFVILLPEANAAEAMIVAERIRSAIATQPLASELLHEGIPMTVSLGVAIYPEDGRTQEDLLQQADHAMYMAKRLGRNQLRTAKEARQASTDRELMALFEEEERSEALEREGHAPEQVRHTYRSGIIASLLSLLEMRDSSMRAHAQEVSDLSIAVAEELGLEPQRVARIGMAALLHDIGKVAVPDMLLQKTGDLTPGEYGNLRQHPELGAQILDASVMLHDLIPAVLHHHERWDGTGYPGQLAGEQIPLAARIIAVAEAYDAMCRDYSYQAGRSTAEARAEIQLNAGTHFDPAIVEIFLRICDRPRKQPQVLHAIGERSSS